MGHRDTRKFFGTYYYHPTLSLVALTTFPPIMHNQDIYLGRKLKNEWYRGIWEIHFELWVIFSILRSRLSNSLCKKINPF